MGSEVRYPKIVNEGETFLPRGETTLTVIGAVNAVLVDPDGVVYQTYTPGTHKEVIPNKIMKVVGPGAQIKVWT